MNENELLEFNYKNPKPLSWCKVGCRISGFGFNNHSEGVIVDFDKYTSKTIAYVKWDDGSNGKYNVEYLRKEIEKGNIKLLRRT
jgi:hypothetical protein